MLTAGAPAMFHRDPPPSHANLEKRYVPLAIHFPAGLALLNVVATTLSLVAGSAGSLLK